jgi:hypothetical protein
MLTQKEVTDRFESAPAQTPTQKNATLKLELAFKEVASELETLVPKSFESVRGFERLFEAKAWLMLSITHEVPEIAKQHAGAKK